MSDYVINGTDAATPTFLIKPYTVNGPLTPASSLLFSNISSGVSAVSVDSSLVFFGKGVPDYGDMIQNNLFYLLENFSNKTRPVKPTPGQLWYKSSDFTDATFPSDPTTRGMYVWTGTAWTGLILNGISQTPIDANGVRITNVGNPISAQDAATKSYTDSTYLPLSGGVLTGALTFGGTGGIVPTGQKLSLIDLPGAGTDAANKTYVDQNILSLQTQTSLDLQAVQDNVDIVSAQFSDYLPLTGGSISGNIVISGTLTLLPGSSVNVGNRVIEAVASPVNNSDAANKLYVDAAITSAVSSIPTTGGSVDGVVTAATLEPVSGTVTLTRSNGLPDVTMSGSVANKLHTHSASDVSMDMSTGYSKSFLIADFIDGGLGYPTPTLYNILVALDRAVYQLQRNKHRQLIEQTVGGTATFTLSDDMEFNVAENELEVYVDGVKQYASERAKGNVTFVAPNVSLTTDTGLASGTYSFTLTIDGTAYPLSINAVAPYTIVELHSDIVTAMSVASVPAQLTVRQRINELDLSFVSNTAGAGSSVLISYTVGSLFESITAVGTAPSTQTVTTSYDYFEVGLPLEPSLTLQFHPASIPPTLSVMEFIVTQ